MTHLLFICSRNQWRSPTAEKLWSRDPAFLVRSAGTSSKARRKVGEKDLQWADVILVMEHRHGQLLRQRFREEMAGKSVHVLGIEDRYRFMDPELIEVLKDVMQPILDSLALES